MSLVFLVGVDCSSCGSRALDYAADRAEVKDAKLLVAHVIEWSPFSFSTPQENEERHKRREEEIQRAYDDIINPILKDLADRDIDVEGVAALRDGCLAGHDATPGREGGERGGVADDLEGEDGRHGELGETELLLGGPAASAELQSPSTAA